MVKEDISKNIGRGRPGTAFELFFWKPICILHFLLNPGILTVFVIICVNEIAFCSTGGCGGGQGGCGGGRGRGKPRKVQEAGGER